MTDTFWGGYSNGLNAINGVGQQVASRRAGARLRQRDYSGAAGALYESGNLQGGMALQEQGDQRQAADSARQLAFTLQATRALKAAKDSGQDVLAAYDSYAPAFTQMGATPEQLQQFRVQLSTNPDGFLNSVEQIVGQQQRELTIRDGGAGDVVGIDPVTGEARLLYDAPDRPIATQFGILLPPGASGANVPNARGEQPITGAAISNAPLSGGPAAVLPSSMVGITAQAESGNRERDARGNLITSSAGAQGRMQVMPTTNTDPGYGVVPARDNSDAERTRVGEDYLAAMMREYGGDPAKAWAAYNWGPGNLNQAISRYGGDWLNYAPAETQEYVSNNLRALNSGQGGVGAQIEQGSEAGPAPTQDLGGGWSLQQMTTPAEERALRSEARQDRREARLDQRAEVQDDRAAREAASAASARTFTQENQLRGQLGQNQAIKDLTAVRPQVGIIGDIAARAARGEQISAQDDLALIFSFMKILDPGSVVREGEFANAQNTAGIPDRIVNAYNNALRGTRLSDGQRNEFFRTATRVIGQYDAAARSAVERTRTTTEAYGLNPDRVAPLPPESRGRQESPVRGVPAQLWESSSPGQQQYWQQNPPSGSRGSQTNPLRLNPSDPTSSYANVRSGQYYLDPNGVRRQRR
jgi:hypothetical protein